MCVALGITGGSWVVSIVWYCKEHNVSETGSSPALRWKGTETHTLLGPFERANLNHWTVYIWWFIQEPKLYVKLHIT
jgi:hypothetical protein